MGVPLLVRLPNWVGDVCMALPALRALAAQGADLTLVGRGWAADLLAGHGWPVLALPRGVRDAARVVRATGIGRGLLLTNSLSSAAVLRLAGVSALGHRGEGRAPLLGRAIARPPPDGHEVEVFWRLAAAAAPWLSLPPLPEGPGPTLGLRLTDGHRAAARAALGAGGLDAATIERRDYLVLAPMAAGTVRGQSKAWPGFADLARTCLASGAVAVCCPGPGEEAAAAQAVPGAHLLPGLGLGAYAAVCAGARVTVANDSGPMHLAAAVDAPVLGVFGPGDPVRTRPWGPQAHWTGGGGRWPTVDAVVSLLQQDLGAARSPAGVAFSPARARTPPTAS
jgi:heptosyltransferase-2